MTKKEYLYHIEADRIIAGRSPVTFLKRISFFFMPASIELFMLRLRKLEYLTGKLGVLNRIKFLVTKYRFNKTSLKLGFSIPPNVFGPGLYIPHYGTIVINKNTKIGACCVLHVSTSIAGPGAKTIGDNFYLSSGSVIGGEIVLADNITVSANSFVNKSFTESNLLIGGTPAKVLKPRDAWFNCDGERFKERVDKIASLK